jgi:tetratricopeptide (TPR) repeat protein
MASTPETPAGDSTTDDVKLDFKRVPGSAAYEVTLPDGKKVRVERTRERVTPGLGGFGPPTGALYDLALEELGEAARSGIVLDLGAGCGIGGRRVVGRVGRLVAVEADASASALAAVFVPRSTVIASTIEGLRLEEPADGALLIDVLGFLDNPLEALRGARRALKLGARLVVADALAFPSQSLVAPARRAGAPAQLCALLECAGFSLLRCAHDGGVVIATGQAIDDPNVDLLLEGARAVAAGDVDRALELFDRIAREAGRSLAVQAVLDAVDVLVALGRADDACGRLLAILRRFPDEPRPLAALSQFMVAAGEPAEARLLAEKAARLAPLEPAVIAALAIALQVSRDPEAAGAWRRAYNLAPDALEIALPAAAHALETGHPLLADRILTRCMAYAGNTKPDAFVMRARVRIALGRTEDAKLDARVALAADPASDEARALVASLEASSAA